VIGAWLNAAGILGGGLVGLWSAHQLSPQRQRQLQVLLGAFTVYVGLSLAWSGLRGSPRQFFGNLALMLLALMLGKLTGHGLGLQRRVNRAGSYANDLLNPSQSVPAAGVNAGFVACTAVYCLAPLAVLGSLAEGLQGDIKPLAIKTVMDTLAAVIFARFLRGGALLSAVPVLVWQGTLTLGTRALLPTLEQRMLVDVLMATTGFLVFAVALVILRIRKIQLADYWPSLLYAPFLALLFR
jgi:uncharacterized membrane protein YqgA involved in biofilm formation